ncbi:hypothetical protein, partial [Pseudomonas sp. ANT_H12B]|uniref:hypothetical protein n=1 Tax=Pseudomonas sp. ANT_H12B TaxID=2597348 RepID=UPI001C49B91A
ITMLAARCLNSREKTLLSFMEPPNWRNHIALKRCPELLGQFSLPAIADSQPIQMVDLPASSSERRPERARSHKVLYSS